MRTSCLLSIALLLSSAAALAQPPAPRSGQMLERMDANGDGSLSREEFLAARADMFAKRDRNADGHLDSEDAGRRAKRRGGERMAQAREHLDTNGDGRISREEFVNGDTPLFDRADKDGNDTLDASELEALRAQMKARAAERSR